MYNHDLNRTWLLEATRLLEAIIPFNVRDSALLYTLIALLSETIRINPAFKLIIRNQGIIMI